MIQLVLARHAKSDWGQPGLSDHDRPLNARGERDAPEMARTIVRQGVRPEVLLSSTAVRARTTAAAFAAAFGIEVDERVELYGASGDEVLAIARDTGAAEVMVVAHDPGMSELVSELAGRDVSMTTCAVAVFTWNDGDWNDVGATPPDDVQLSTPR
jgi:phosphohistidine phosphatase